MAAQRIEAEVGSLPVLEGAAAAQPEPVAKSAHALIQGALGTWGKPSRGWRRIAWAKRTVPSTKALKEPDELPPQRLQLLRVLAALTAYFPERAETGFLAEEIVAVGLVLYPGSRLFVAGTDILVFPTTKLVEAKIGDKSREGLAGSGVIVRHRETLGDRKRSKKPFGVKPTETRVILTSKGAEEALQRRWVPIGPSFFRERLQAAQGGISLGIIKFK